MIPKQLKRYYVTKVRVKHMGRNKKDKKFYSIEWNPEMSRREYLREYMEADPRGCGLFLCRVEFNDLTEDRWWDTPGYRGAVLAEYRRKITRIRKQYGLASSEVKEFMRV